MAVRLAGLAVGRRDLVHRCQRMHRPASLRAPPRDLLPVHSRARDQVRVQGLAGQRIVLVIVFFGVSCPRPCGVRRRLLSVGP